jgi:BASS family bile acid:Na+ symporter
MQFAELIRISLQASMGLIVVGIALRARVSDVTYLFRRPALLARSLLAMSVVTPVLAATIAAVFDLRPELEIALLLVAVSPVPPLLPGARVKKDGDASYAAGLLALSAASAIVTAPLSVAALARLFGRSVRAPIAEVALAVVFSVLVPLTLGIWFKRVRPAVAERIARPIAIAGNALLVLTVVPILVVSWEAIVGEIGQGTLLAIVLFSLVNLGIGHALGGPIPENRTVLAISTANRHPAVALVIAGAVAKEPALVSAAVLLYVLVSAFVMIPYVNWRRRTHDAPGSAMD